MNVQITINGRELSVELGLSILQAARLNDIEIPTLCDYPGLPTSGSCRLCVVEIEGRPTTPTACTTPAEEGMVIQTHSEKIRSLRMELFQMLLAEHPACCFYCPEQDHCDECMVTLRKAGVTTGCRSCPKDGQCRLQTLVEEIGLPRPGYPVRYRMLGIEKKDPFFDRDYNLCVLCGRCIRTCEQLHFNNALVYTRRGAEAVVGTAFGRTHLEAGCSFCGACVAACPTGALSEKNRKWDGIPDTETATTCPLCSLGCQARLLARDGRVIGSLPEQSSGGNALCVEGRFGFAELLNHPERLVQPLRKAGAYSLATGWDEAIQAAADKLACCPPGRFQMLLSPDLTNEDLFVAHKFAREVMLTAPYISSAMPNSARDWAAFYQLLKQSDPLTAIDDADAILCLGVDGKYAQSVVEVVIRRAFVRGAKLATVHPFEHSLGQFAHVWLRPESCQAIEAIQLLSGMIGGSSLTENPGKAVAQADQFAGAVQILRGSTHPVILLGSDFLSHLPLSEIAPAVQVLLDTLAARLVLLPPEGNLAGALLIASLFPIPAAESSMPAVTYLIGLDLPASTPDAPEIIYQNISHPLDEENVFLQLPAAAFSETAGTSINHAGCVTAYRQAVQPPQGALPSWEILCRIARRMGAVGFNYTSPEDIRNEIAAVLPGFIPGERVFWPDRGWGNHIFEHMKNHSKALPVYMGQPLQMRVAGLRDLDVEKNLAKWGTNVPHS